MLLLDSEVGISLALKFSYFPSAGPVFSTSRRSISLPTLVASGNRGLKYSCILVNRFLYDSKSENETHSAQPYMNTTRQKIYPGRKCEFHVISPERIIVNCNLNAFIQ